MHEMYNETRYTIQVNVHFGLRFTTWDIKKEVLHVPHPNKMCFSPSLGQPTLSLLSQKQKCSGLSSQCGALKGRSTTTDLAFNINIILKLSFDITQCSRWQLLVWKSIRSIFNELLANCLFATSRSSLACFLSPCQYDVTTQNKLIMIQVRQLYSLHY